MSFLLQARMEAVGLDNGTIPDFAISASSVDRADASPYLVRLIELY